MKELFRYKEGEIENLKERLKIPNKNTQASMTHTRRNTESTPIYSEHINPSGSVGCLNTTYEKFSTSRKGRRKYKVMELSSFKGGLMNYGLVNSMKQRFNLTSPVENNKPRGRPLSKM
jgi:hypothetical protein